MINIYGLGSGEGTVYSKYFGYSAVVHLATIPLSVHHFVIFLLAGIHMLALSITYEGDSIKSKDGELTVKVSAPDLLVADLSEVTIKEPSSKTVS